MESMSSDDRDTFSKLLNDPSVNVDHFQEEWPVTALMYSFALRKYDYTEELIRSGADVRATNSEGVNALMLALRTIPNNERLRYRIVNMIVDSLHDEKEIENLLDADHMERYRKLMESGGGGTSENQSDTKDL